jgi:hypothetical protein
LEFTLEPLSGLSSSSGILISSEFSRLGVDLLLEQFTGIFGSLNIKGKGVDSKTCKLG